MELYKGRPENTEGRLEKEVRVYDINTSSIKLKAADVWEKILPAVHHEMMTVKLTGEV